MSRLLELKSRIEKLPQLQKQKQNNARVAAFRIQVDNALHDIKERVESRARIQVVFPDAKLKKTIDAVKQSKLQAARLIEKLNEDFNEIASAETDKKITRIKERNAEAHDEIRRSWKKNIEEELKPFHSLVEIAREAALPGHEEIVASMASLNSTASSPPETLDSARQIRINLDCLRTSLGDLDLEGPGGEFLKNAVNGKANPKDLLNEEVREFLDAKDLWDILTISVG